MKIKYDLGTRRRMEQSTIIIAFKPFTDILCENCHKFFCALSDYQQDSDTPCTNGDFGQSR